MKRCVLLIAVMVTIPIILACSSAGGGKPPKGAYHLFDGKTLDGWRKLTEYSGEDGKWEVIDGAIAGDQYPEGKNTTGSDSPTCERYRRCLKVLPVGLE